MSKLCLLLLVMILILSLALFGQWSHLLTQMIHLWQTTYTIRGHGTMLTGIITEQHAWRLSWTCNQQSTLKLEHAREESAPLL